MSVDSVRTFLTKFNRQEDIMEFDVSSATVPLAALALGTQECRIAKTLSFQDGQGGCRLVVTAGDAKISNRKYKDTFGMKAKMLTAQEAIDMTGHAVGGVCPFALPAGVTVYLDDSMKRFKTVFPACGSANSAIELTCDELFEYSAAAGWVEVCDIPESE